MSASYATRQLAQALREARLANGDSQMELAERAGLGQNRLALIESGDVDLRTSTLIQLARALDLELVLVPRRLLPAVQSLSGGQPKPDQGAKHRSVRRSPMRALRQILGHLAVLERDHPNSTEIVQARRAAQALHDAGSELPLDSLQPLRRAVHCLARARTNHPEAQRLMAKAAAQLMELRTTLPQTGHPGQLPRPQPAAYGLEDELS